MVAKPDPFLGRVCVCGDLLKRSKLVLCMGAVCLSVPLGRMKDMS